MTTQLSALPWEAILACATPMQSAFDALDQQLSAAVRQMRARRNSTLDELRGVAVGPDRVEALLAEGRLLRSGDVHDGAAHTPLTDGLLLMPAWRALAAWGAVHAVERDLVLLALARELFSHYETVFGYLNDDLTRRWPTRVLAQRLLASSETDACRIVNATGSASPLVTGGVLQRLELAPHAGAASQGFTLTPLACALLGDVPEPWRHLPSSVLVEERPDATLRAGLPLDVAQALVPEASAADAPMLIVEGRLGSGRTQLARAMATERGSVLLHVTLAPPRTADDRNAQQTMREVEAIRDAVLFQRLAGAVILVDGLDAWCTTDHVHGPPLDALRQLASAEGPVVLRVGDAVSWQRVVASQRVARIVMPRLIIAERTREWQSALARQGLDGVDVTRVAAVLASRFDITPSEIRRVVQRVSDERRGGLQAHSDNATLIDDLSLATRMRARDALGALATLAPTPHVWGDLVLPVSVLRRLQEFAHAVRDRHIVLDTWQFARRAATSRGATALFAGASGTGKTMACSVIARELGLDLFVIDLSAVVSKYIGETEKNLDRIFRAARETGAILFFDEADALFGKRSEVKDAHDRYANIEVAYLLQQLDAHPGIVVLATNLARNLDAAFSRRMRYVVEFPLPGEADRLRLWQGMLPVEAPLASDVDLPFLADGFAIAGGDIRNVVLDAAYLAASDGQGHEPIAMRHFVVAMARQCVKQGVTPSVAQFRQYAGLLPRLG